MTIPQWSTALVVNQPGFVTVTIAGGEPVVLVDVVVGGLVATRITGGDFRDVRSLVFRVGRLGTFPVVVRALDAAGCLGSSAAQVRNVWIRAS